MTSEMVTSVDDHSKVSPCDMKEFNLFQASQRSTGIFSMEDSEKDSKDSRGFSSCDSNRLFSIFNLLRI